MVNWRNRSSCARRAPRTESLRGAAAALWLPLLLATTSCGRAEPAKGVQPAGDPSPLCVPSDRGYLRARLQGSIDSDLDWSSGKPQCRGGLRPSGDGVRLLYKGDGADGGSLLIVLGAGPLRAGENARNVPVNFTVVREGTGEFYATQGDDKCTLDEVRQEPLADHAGQYLLTGRGYCLQPARSVGGTGSVLMSRFDVEAIVDYQQ